MADLQIEPSRQNKAGKTKEHHLEKEYRVKGKRDRPELNPLKAREREEDQNKTHRGRNRVRLREKTDRHPT